MFPKAGRLPSRLWLRVRPRGLQGQLAFIFSAVFLAALVLTYAVEFFGIPLTDYDGRLGYYRRQATARLDRAADLTERRIRDWIEERRRDMHLFVGNEWFGARLAELSATLHDGDVQPLAIPPQEAQARLQGKLAYYSALTWLEEIRQTFGQYREIAVIDAPTGTILVSTDQSRVGATIQDTPYLEEARRHPKGVASELTRDAAGRPVLALSHCVPRPGGGSDAVIVLYVDTQHSLPTILDAVKGIEEADEALLFDQRGRDLSRRLAPRATASSAGADRARAPGTGRGDGAAASANVATDRARDKRVPAEVDVPAPRSEPIRRALAGQRGIIATSDYAGRPVLAAYRPLQIADGPRWALVVKEDRAAIWAPIQHHLLSSLGVLVAAALAVCGLAVAVARGVARPIRELSKRAEEVASGNLTTRACSDGSRELIQLTRTFNQMVSRLQHWQRDMEAEVASRTAELENINEALQREAAARQQIQEDLARANTELDHVFNAAVPLAVFDLEGRVLRVNETFASLLRADPEQLTEHRCRDAAGCDRCETTGCPLTRIARGEQRVDFETELNRRDGTSVTCSITCIPYRDASNRLIGIVQSVIDVTEQRQAIAELRESKQRLELALTGGQVGMWDWYVQTGRVEYDQRWARILGYPPEEVEPTLDFFLDRVHPEDRAGVQARLDEHLARRSPYYESEHRMRTKNGQWKWIYDRGRVVQRDCGGRVVRASGTILDVSRRKKNEAELERYRHHLEDLVTERTDELRQTQDALLRQERLAALGQLIGAVSHELRNPLGALHTAVQLLARRVEGKQPQLEDVVCRMKRSIKRCDSIIADLLDYTRGSQIDREPTDFDLWLAGVVDEFAVPADVALIRRLDASAIVAIDRERFRRVLINLLSNAVQALPKEGGTVTVTSRAHGQRLLLEVSDTGCGIAAEQLATIFEPLFSTKSFGVGLGLPIVARLIEQHEGQISLDSQVGRGTTVTVDLPLCSEGVPDAASAANG